MRRVFIDCGGHKASSVKLFEKHFPHAEKYEIHSFEANPNLRSFYRKYAERIKFYPKAVWIKDGYVSFYIGRNNQNMSASVIKGKKTGMLKKKPIEVKCIDFSMWLKSNFSKNDYIVLKMDIEGAEYQVLNKMIEDRTIEYVDELFMDWHYTKLPMESSEHHDLVEKLHEIGLTSKNWAVETDHIEGITHVDNSTTKDR